MIPKLGLRPKTILYGVLNWGLGHATRSIPIIRHLLNEGHKVILASDGNALTLLSEEFPQLAKESLFPYNVQYNSEKLWPIVISNAPRILRAIINEKRKTNQLVSKYKANLIISDSRFGFRSKRVQSIIISHQLRLRSESLILKQALNQVNKYFLNSFNACWIPDNAAHLLSGELSKNQLIKKQHFIGPVSRLKKKEEDHEYDLGIILSGPEPARTNLETSLIDKYKDSAWQVCLIRGTTENSIVAPPKHWLTKNLATASEVNDIIFKCQNLISRSGYTSIMDFYSVGKGAYLIPTPGQSEQEYLAAFLHGKYGFVYAKSLEDLPISC